MTIVQGDVPSDSDPGAVDLLFEQFVSEADRAIAQIKSLEARGTQAFGAATVLLGLASFGTASTSHINKAAFALLTVGILAYVLAGLASVLKLLAPTKVHGRGAAQATWDQLRKLSPASIKASMIQTIVDAETDNDKAIKSRVFWARVVVFLVALEGAMVGFFILITRVPPS